jgi:hypothetical protein
MYSRFIVRAMKGVTAGVLGLCVGACSHSEVLPVAALDTKEMCVIERPGAGALGADFLRAYQQALRDKGYSTKVLPPNSSLDTCAVVSTYSARWSLDPFLYLQSAEIYVYKSGRPSGRALFQAPHSAFFTTEGKVRELVRQLYP